MIRQNKLQKLLISLSIFCFTISLFSGFSYKVSNDELTTGQTYSGFKLTSQKYVEDIDSNVMIFNHVKSGAKLLFMQNNDDNKVFSIAFKTPPSDNTGVNHIIEHSVLDGSLNYPVKSPFLEIGKRSLNTFLNAYTASDRTIFPVASRNEKDFNNLMGIYLDAVFHPNVLKDKRIFLQEAGHYEMDSKTSDLTYKGVVYNEMKGNLSSPDSMLSDQISESLFPDTQYKWNSGGTPEAIPTLTWEKLKDTYNKYYQPSNSYICLYGNVDIKKTLEFIDSKYLSKISGKKVNITETLQKPYAKQRSIVSEYPVDKGTDISKKAMLAQNFVIDKFTNKDDAVAMMFLNYLLLGNNGSPLKSALLNNNIGSNVYGNVNIDGLQTTYSIIAENASADQKDKFHKVINDTLKSLLNGGLDKSYISSLVHSFEISFRAGRSDANRGISYDSMVYDSWINGGDPMEYLSLNSTIDKIKDAVNNDYFQELIKKYLLNNKLTSMVVLKPVPGLAEKMDADSKKANKKLKAKLSSKEIDNIVKQTADLKKWQAAPDSTSALSKLPSLDISDIDKQAEVIPTDIKDENGVKLLTHPLYTNKIVYSDLYFDTTCVPKDKLPYLYLLSTLLGGLDTQNYSYMQLINAANGCLGSLSFTPYAVTKYDDMNTFSPKLDVSFYTLDSDLPKAFDIINEIVNNTKFDNLQLMQQYIKMIRSSMDNNIVNAGSQISESRLESYYSEFGKYNDVSSIPFYKFITDLDDNFSAKSDEIVKNLKEVSGLVFNKKNMMASVTCDSDLYDAYAKEFDNFAGKLNDSEVTHQTYTFDDPVKNEGIMSTSQVQYIAQGYDINKLGYKYSGKMQVLASIINGDYIWNKVRELGGAYGGSFNISANGNAEFLSWRDPNLKETLDIFSKAGDFIKNYNLTDKDLENYVISTIGSMDRPMSPSEKGKSSDMNYISGVTQDVIQKQRDEVLSTSLEDIRSFGDMLNKITEQKDFCVFGAESKIMENKDIFNATINISSK